jgi:hypothetical protein
MICNGDPFLDVIPKRYRDDQVKSPESIPPGIRNFALDAPPYLLS